MKRSGQDLHDELKDVVDIRQETLGPAFFVSHRIS
jgi:hypothetical protein